jgi:hypothetical protein
MPSRRTLLVAVLTLGLLSAACGGSDEPTVAPSGGATPSSTMAASVASTDLWAGDPQRFELGVFSSDGQGVTLLTFGTVDFAFSYLGDGSSSPSKGPEVTGTYLGAFGTPQDGPAPSLSAPSDARGVYLADGVTFDRPGIWQVDTTFTLAPSGTQTLTAQFPVSAKPLLPAPGQAALRTENLTMDSKGVPPSAIDSRALDGAPVPDPGLHETTIAAAIAAHRPVVVIFATPTYCQSQFCGPEVDAVEALAKRYADKATFIHVEIWRDFQNSVINKAAADWLYRKNDLTEPWLYVIGADGVIKDRWGPLFDQDEVAKEISSL